MKDESKLANMLEVKAPEYYTEFNCEVCNVSLKDPNDPNTIRFGMEISGIRDGKHHRICGDCLYECIFKKPVSNCASTKEEG